MHSNEELMEEREGRECLRSGTTFVKGLELGGGITISSVSVASS